MSMDKSIYIGQYVRARLPQIEIKVSRRYCGNNHPADSTPLAKYCQLCGSPISEKIDIEKQASNIYEFLIDALDDGDMFHSTGEYSDPDGWQYFLGNKAGGRQGGFCVISGNWGDGRVSELPERVGLVGDWADLCIFLSEHEIPYELKYGIIEYWS